jgi:hypothetical protein
MKHIAQGAFVCLTLASSALASQNAAASLDPRELLSVAYPQSKGHIKGTGIVGRDAIKIPKLDLPDVKWPWLPQPPRQTTSDSNSTTVEIVPISIDQLDDAHAVMITVATPVDSGGHEQCDSYGCLQAVSAHFFTRKKNAWHLAKQFEAVGRVYPGLDTPRIRPWPGHGFLFSGMESFFAQGAGTDSMVLMGLDVDHVSFFDEVPIAEENDAFPAGNDGSPDADCGDLVDSKHEPKLRSGYMEALDCRHGSGKWTLERNAIKIRYEIYQRGASKDGNLLPLEHTVETVILKPAGGQLKSISGTLPRFGF